MLQIYISMVRRMAQLIDKVVISIRVYSNKIVQWIHKTIDRRRINDERGQRVPIVDDPVCKKVNSTDVMAYWPSKFPIMTSGVRISTKNEEWLRATTAKVLC